MRRSESARTDSHFSSKTSLLICLNISSSGDVSGAGGPAVALVEAAMIMMPSSMGVIVLNIRSGPLLELIGDQVQPQEELSAGNQLAQFRDLLNLGAVVERRNLDEDILEVPTDVLRPRQ